MPPEILGKHLAIQRLRAKIPSFAASEKPLVIIGEKGVGKTLFAAHVHAQSPLHAQRLASLNAWLLQQRDQAVQLFGGEPPLLTTTRKGILERHTTALVKHPDFLPLHLQRDLAGALDSQLVQRMGSEHNSPVLARVVVTLWDSPSSLHRRGRLVLPLYESLMRADHVRIPPLRHRVDDIPLLAHHFLRELKERARALLARPVLIRGLNDHGRLNPRLSMLLQQQQWPENVHSLKIFLRSLLVLTFEDLLESAESRIVNGMLSDVEERKELSLSEQIQKLRDCIERHALRQSGGNVRRAAQLLGMSEGALHKRMKKLVGT